MFGNEHLLMEHNIPEEEGSLYEPSLLTTLLHTIIVIILTHCFPLSYFTWKTA
jgi:hypothetical protein